MAAEKNSADAAGPVSFFSRRAARVALGFGAPVVAGAVLGPLADDASRASYPKNFAHSLAASPEVAGEGVLVGALGGLRTLTADIFWLRAYLMWERRERAACTTYSRVALALAPDNRSIREGYAQWLAYDFPVWSIHDLGGMNRVPASEQEAIHRRDSRAGIAFLEDSLIRDPDTTGYLVVASRIANIKLKDEDLAAGFHRRAAETHAAPLFSAAVYAGHLIRRGRSDEARAWFLRYIDRLIAQGAGHRGALWITNYRSMISPDAPEYELLGEGIRRLERAAETPGDSR